MLDDSEDLRSVSWNKGWNSATSACNGFCSESMPSYFSSKDENGEKESSCPYTLGEILRINVKKDRNKNTATLRQMKWLKAESFNSLPDLTLNPASMNQ